MRMMPGTDYRPRIVIVKTKAVDSGVPISSEQLDLSATDYDMGTAMVCELVRKAIDTGDDVEVIHD